MFQLSVYKILMGGKVGISMKLWSYTVTQKPFFIENPFFREKKHFEIFFQKCIILYYYWYC